MIDLTTGEKIAAIETSGLTLAFDGCHKIYFLDGKAAEAEARSNGYEIIPAVELRSTIMSSCPLVFVSDWHLSNNHPWDIGQCTEDIYEEADREPAQP